MSGIRFVKGHAYGNDFLLVAESEMTDRDPASLAKAMCQRQTGVGADGLMLYANHDGGAKMRLFNADGSASEVSGNGVRCLAALIARDTSITSPITIDTAAGPKVLELMRRDGAHIVFRAAMGKPRDIRVGPLDAAGERVQAVTLSVGNPQCVLLNDPLDLRRFERLGPALEHHPHFPNRTNVSFVRVESPERLRILIWERGVGPTMASGTGACGAAVAAIAHAGAVSRVEVASPGGSQSVEWGGSERDEIYLTGWAELTVEGRYLANSD